MEWLELLWGTILLRPYVFLFLLTFLAMAVPMWGWRRTIIYTIIGYTVAWSAEFSSIHNGFPFGDYYYISDPTITRELWIFGVPFMDSLSFVFLTFAGFLTARLILEPIVKSVGPRLSINWLNNAPNKLIKVWLLGGILTMLLDIVIDPVALQGDRWFLGSIYGYPPGSPYFSIPFANFAGWAFVSWLIIGGFLLLDRLILKKYFGEWKNYYNDALSGIILFAGVLAFNIIVTFAIGEIWMGIVGLVWASIVLIPATLKISKTFKKTSYDQLISTTETSAENG